MRAAFVLVPIALLAACKVKEEPTPVASETASAAPSVAAAASSTAVAPAPFSVDGVPESTASIPPFPLFKDLEGLENVMHGPDINRAFDRDYFIAGTALQTLEGKTFRSKYNLTLERPYSDIEFRRNYELAVTELGGAKIGGPISTDKYRWDLEKTNPPPQSPCFTFECNADFYLIRQGGKEWWISVGTGSFPLHGYVTVLERQGMAKSYSFVDAAGLKSALDANGRVPVYVEFDVDRATIRPSARGQVDEIVKLMQQNAGLKVSIEGHTDDTGTSARNGPLSIARAEAVRAALLAAGIDPARMKTAGFGATRPLVKQATDEARARNRRVELVKM